MKIKRREVCGEAARIRKTCDVSTRTNYITEIYAFVLVIIVLVVHEMYSTARAHAKLSSAPHTPPTQLIGRRVIAALYPKYSLRRHHESSFCCKGACLLPRSGRLFCPGA